MRRTKKTSRTLASPAQPAAKRRLLCRRTRAIWDEDKSSRQQDLVDGVAQLFAKRDFAAISIQDICKAADLAKGTFYLYFKTKEEIFLKLAETQLRSWSTASQETLTKLPVSPSVDIAAQRYAETFAGYNDLLRLLSLLHAIIERNVEPEQIVPFKRYMVELQTAQVTEWRRVFPRMDEALGLELMAFISSAIVGVWTITQPPETARRALAMAELPEPAVPFVSIFARQLEVFLRGLVTP